MWFGTAEVSVAPIVRVDWAIRGGPFGSPDCQEVGKALLLWRLNSHCIKWDIIPTASMETTFAMA